MNNIGPIISKHGVEKQGIRNARSVSWNLGAEALYEETIRRGEGVMADGGALVVRTGQHTGRSANDKFIVREPSSENTVSWGSVNRPISENHFDGLHGKILAYLQGKDLFVQDLWAGAEKAHQIRIRVISESPWHSLFIRNLLIRPDTGALPDFDPEYVILHAPNFLADPAVDGTRSETVITAHFGKKVVLVAGTSYAGEIKKSVFSILNYILPEKDVMPMHCSANIGKDGDTAIFFGLSGTGKTTLSADPNRVLIGDDEHGWSDTAVFNFEGGCYAKMIRLSADAEPEIYATSKRFGTVLENVVIDPVSRQLDLDDNRHTENTRGAYPIHFIPNTSESGVGTPPTNIIMLTADAFGVLPPIAKLSPAQAMYHFLSGYTAKVAGTEKGLGNEPQATFSTCFGAPFMPRHPSVYGNLLRDKIANTGVNCWLVNTGWTGGVHGVGKRMPIKATRALLNAALDGSLATVEMRTDPNFGFQVPVSCPGVDSKILTPRDTWADAAAYDKKAQELVKLFTENFAQFTDYVDDAVRAAAPKAA